jgi:hypothetical protein
MRLRSKLCLLPMLAAAALAWADATRKVSNGDHVSVPAMRTSIYIGSVTLVPSVFSRHGDTYEATYEANVWPWIFWSEKGEVSIKVPETDLQRALKGETIEFSGGGYNQRSRHRTVTGRLQPHDATSGKIKIRISADGFTLVFNGTYRFDNAVK